MSTVPWGGRRVPFTLLGGYLGAGKTTILNHAIQHADGRRFAVLVNDIGAVNVDAALVADHDGRTLSLTNGCVCCSIAGDLGPALEELRSLPEPPDHVIMELSGVAQPARVASWGSTAGFRLDGVVVAVDADRHVELEARGDIGDTIRAQIDAADLIALTKTDLAVDGGAGALARMAECSDAPVVRVVDGAVDLSVLLGIETTVEQRVVPDATVDHDHVVHIRPMGGLTFDQLTQAVAALPPATLRAKGVVRCVDREHPVEVNVVGRRRRVRERPDLERTGWVQLDSIVVIER